MSKDVKGDHKHLTLSDRVYIEQALLHVTFLQIPHFCPFSMFLKSTQIFIQEKKSPARFLIPRRHCLFYFTILIIY